MKYLLTLITFFISAAAFSQAHMKFDSTQIDLGTFQQGEKAETIIEFVNDGDQPLIIQNIKTSCSCTATNWPKEPIQPGDSSSITVVFNTKGKKGRYAKGVNIFTNAGEYNLVVEVEVLIEGVRSRE
jgi:hypothetical protein